MRVHVVEYELGRDVDPTVGRDENVLGSALLSAVHAETARVGACGYSRLPGVHEQVCELRVDLSRDLAQWILATPLKPSYGQQPGRVAVWREVIDPHADCLPNVLR